MLSIDTPAGMNCDFVMKKFRLTPLDRRVPAPGFPNLPEGLSWHIYGGDDYRCIGFVDNDGWIQRGVRVHEDESLVQAAQRCKLRLAELGNVKRKTTGYEEAINILTLAKLER